MINDITTIIEDKTGKLWIGTRGDAFVYDGKTFTTLTHKGKAFNNVWSIIEDKKGNIWLGADGLFRYDGRTFTKVTQRGGYAIIEDKKETSGLLVKCPMGIGYYPVMIKSPCTMKSLQQPELCQGTSFIGAFGS